MDENIMLSVTITVYNQINYISDAVESILNQNMDFNYEILIGDDGSNDGSYEYIQKLYARNEHIRIFKMQRLGGGDSVNEYADWRHSRLIRFLINEAKGKYVSILDGDDYYCNKDGFSRKIEILESDENQDCIACSGEMRKIEPNGTVREPNKYHNARKMTLEQYFFKDKGHYIPIAACVIRRNVFENISELLYESFTDQMILDYILHFGKLYLCTECDFTYRQMFSGMENSLKDTERAIIRVGGFDIRNQIFGDFYYKILISRRRDYAYIDKYKKQIPELVDWNMWYDFAKKNNLERLLSLMDCPEANYGIRKKVKNELLFLKFLNFLMYPLDFYKYSLKVKIRYVEESILWLAQRDIPRDEKIKRIKMVLKR